MSFFNTVHSAIVKRLAGALLFGAAVLVQTFPAVSVSAEEIPQLIPEDAVCFNGHYYKIYQDLGAMKSTSWDTANNLCIARGGHLATITSEEENSLVYSLLQNEEFDNVLFGLYQSSGTWTWVNEEQSEFLFWAEGEPNDGKSKPHGMYSKAYPNGEWVDGKFLSDTSAYVCEWDSGVYLTEAVKTDTNGNLVLPDGMLEFGKSRYKIFDSGLTASQAETFCSAYGGHLVFIESEEEQNFLMEKLNESGQKTMYWIGARENGEWGWSSGGKTAPLEYTHWSRGEPQNSDGDSVYSVLNLKSKKFSSGGWVAESEVCAEYRESEYYPNCGFICEWEISCVSSAGEFLFHSAKDWEVIQKANCAEDGYQKLVCENCGQVIQESTIPKGEHDFELARMIELFDFNPIPGVKRYTCTICNEPKTDFDEFWLVMDAFFVGVIVIMIKAFLDAKRDYNERRHLR